MTEHIEPQPSDQPPAIHEAETRPVDLLSSAGYFVRTDLRAGGTPETECKVRSGSVCVVGC